MNEHPFSNAPVPAKKVDVPHGLEQVREWSLHLLAALPRQPLPPGPLAQVGFCASRFSSHVRR